MPRREATRNDNKSYEIDKDVFIEGLWEGSRKSKNDENAKNVEKSQLETFDNDSENDIIELTLDNITKDILKTKPLNSPKPDRWISSGGSISIDNGDWVYTNADGISVKYVDGYPDFKGAGLVIQEVDVVEFVNRAIDKRKAREVVEQGENTVWHHPPDGHMLQEIDANIHNQFTHIGGIAKMKKGE